MARTDKGKVATLRRFYRSPEVLVPATQVARVVESRSRLALEPRLPARARRGWRRNPTDGWRWRRRSVRQARWFWRLDHVYRWRRRWKYTLQHRRLHYVAAGKRIWNG